MIKLFDKNITDFSTGGIELKDAIYCVIEEELNGIYQLELHYPIDQDKIWEGLIEESIIFADGQAFRINRVEQDLSLVYVKARHIFYDLLYNHIDYLEMRESGTSAIVTMLNNTQYPNIFIGTSDIGLVKRHIVENQNVVEALLGETSFITRWGGDIARDNFNIEIKERIGVNKGAQIQYGNNILGLNVIRSTDNLVTRIIPVGHGGLKLPEGYIDSPKINQYSFPYVKVIDFDIGPKPEVIDDEGYVIEEEITEADAIVMLREATQDMFLNERIDEPEVNVQADLLLLQNTEEYKDFTDLEVINLGDTVSCSDNPLGISFERRVIKIKKDALTGRALEVEIGDSRRRMSEDVSTVTQLYKKPMQVIVLYKAGAEEVWSPWKTEIIKDTIFTAPRKNLHEIDINYMVVEYVPAGEITITFEYVKLEEMVVTIRYVDTLGNPIRDSRIERGRKTISFGVPDIWGYVYQGTEKYYSLEYENGVSYTIDLVYEEEKNMKVTVSYIDTLGNQIKTGEVHNEKRMIWVFVPQIEGYKYQGRSTTFTYPYESGVEHDLVLVYEDLSEEGVSGVREIFIETRPPGDLEGKDGDIWLVIEGLPGGGEGGPL